MLALALLGACSGERFATRPVGLVSPERAVDALVAQSRELAAQGDLSGATGALGRVLREHPSDPLAPWCRIATARLLLAQHPRGACTGTPEALAACDRGIAGFEDRARALAQEAAGAEPAVELQRALVLGLVDARRRDPQGFGRLEPLVGRMIDRAQHAEVECGVAELSLAAVDALEARATPTESGAPALPEALAAGRRRAAARALAALSAAEALAEDGVLWLPTGLVCDRAEDRARAVASLVSRVEAPEALTGALDALPARSGLRRLVARRLRQVAEDRGEIARYIRWLADLGDDEATLAPVVAERLPAALVLGVLAPVSGARASLGVMVVREAQLALAEERAVRILVEDEGVTQHDALGAFERLAAGGALAVLGPTQEELSAAVARRAQARGVPVWLLAPHEGADAMGPLVHPAGPPPGERAVALAAQVRRAGARVAWEAVASGGDASAFELRAREALALAGVTVTAPDGGPLGLHLVAGPVGPVAGSAFAARARAQPGRWFFDARSARPGTAGVWVGLAANEGPPFDAHLGRYCDVAGEPPGELGMLAYDAALEALRALRPAAPAPGPLLAHPWIVRAALVTAEEPSLAAARRCP